MVNSLSNKSSKCMDRLLKIELVNILEDRKTFIVDSIMKKYDSEFSDLYVDSRCMITPQLLYEPFKEKLYEFISVYVNINSVGMEIPDIENFKFDGKLIYLKDAFEGRVGDYGEIGIGDYMMIFGQSPPPDEYYSAATEFNLPVVRPYDELKEKIRSSDIVSYIFSGVRNKDVIIEEGDKVYKNNVDKWINEAINKATIEFEKECSR